MRRLLFVIPAALFVLAACGSDPETKAPPVPAPASQTPSVSPTTQSPTPEPEPVDEDGQRACSLVEKAVEANSLMKPGVVEEIAEAGEKSTNGYVAIAAKSLPAKLELAIAAKGENDEFAMSAGLLTAAIEMETECTRGGLN